MWYVLLIAALPALMYILSLRGRTGHPGLAQLQGWYYAHRGLHDKDRPENSMAAFRAALEHGYGIELDVHLLKDGNLAVMHDSALLRTTGREGRMEELTTEVLADYHLGGTEETIPEFRRVLELYAGKAPLIVELKPADGNHARLAEAACRMLDGYRGAYCVESFDPRCVLWLKKHRPEVIRGQLAENFLKSGGTLPWYVRWIMTCQLANFVTRPDFVAYRYRDRKRLGNFLVRKLWRVQGVSWTVQTPEEFRTAVEEGWLPIFEGFQP